MSDEVQTVTVTGGGSYTITFPSAPMPKGTVIVMDGGTESTNMIYDGQKWLRADPCSDDVTKYSDAKLSERMDDIVSLFKLCEELGIDSRYGSLVSLAERASEYNRCEEEQIRRGDLPKFNLEVTLGELSMEPGSPARIMVDAVAAEIRRTIDGLEEVTESTRHP